ncbi:grpE protein homolog 1, mitochondrial [Panulirus ornatus]|uniref:grpE protein homolog 1, mitochondrial n=1 Tax=Panulirus ornatus TaxID=150431 RepID=UPI003A863EB3
MAVVNMSTVFSGAGLRHSSIFRKAASIGWVYRSHRPITFTSGKAAGYSEPKKQDQECPSAEKPAECTDAEKQLQEHIASLTKENESLVKKVASYQDKYQRTLADRENVRNRLEKQIAEAKQYGIQGFCKDLLEVSDVFRKAIESVPVDTIQQGSSDLKNLYDGLVMTENQLLTVFRRHGLVQIMPEIGEKFDPSFQEAMFELPLPDKEPGTVAHIIRTGWTLHSRCIRSAQVGVVKD